jgi:hypothetical protein
MTRPSSEKARRRGPGSKDRDNLRESPRIPRLPSSFVLFFVLIKVRLRGILSVVSSMQTVAMRDMGMMSALFMRSFFVMSGRLLVMARCVLVMFSGLLMMFHSLMLWHLGFSSFFVSQTLQLRIDGFQNEGAN